jgi:hypothetical protein
MKLYRAGNALRGVFYGKFKSIDEAWSYLSTRFLISFPTDDPDGARSIELQVEENNSYGFKQFLTCKRGETERNNLDRDDVLNKCTRS